MHATHTREHHVQDDNIVPTRERTLQTMLPIVDGFHDKIFLCEAFADQAA